VYKQTLTVVEHIYQQSPKESPFGIECINEQQLDSEDQPYSRTYNISNEWEDLDCGWIEEVGQIHIENKGKEEVFLGHKELLTAVACRGNATVNLFRVPSGCSTRIYPHNDLVFRVRSREEASRITVTAFPR